VCSKPFPLFKKNERWIKKNNPEDEWCYKNKEIEFNEINIINNILFEVYKIQKNVVFINVEKQSKSHIFSFSDREKTFSY